VTKNGNSSKPQPAPSEVNVNINENKQSGYGILIEYELCTPNEAAYLKRLAAGLDKRSLGQQGTLSEGRYRVIEGSIG